MRFIEYSGAGKIYWTEKNDVAQNFYGTVNWKICTSIGYVRGLMICGHALFAFQPSRYLLLRSHRVTATLQLARPMQFGVDMRCRF
ncbi:MAG: hypothetical protein R2738_00115 [Bacteroides graminisolvens]